VGPVANHHRLPDSAPSFLPEQYREIVDMVADASDANRLQIPNPAIRITRIDKLEASYRMWNAFPRNAAVHKYLG
jgi:hypothetical protein